MECFTPPLSRLGRCLGILFWLSLLLPIPGSAAPPPGRPLALLARMAEATPVSLDRLLDLMQARLNLAEAVARSKWNLHLPLEDRVREQQLLDQMADVPGLDPALARAFLEAQMEASKTVQRQFHRRWQQEGRGPFDDMVPLSQLRQQLDPLTRQLLETLSRVQPQLADPHNLEREIDQRWSGALPPEWKQALAPLLPLKE